jgi:hypothetical protein
MLDLLLGTVVFLLSQFVEEPWQLQVLSRGMAIDCERDIGPGIAGAADLLSRSRSRFHPVWERNYLAHSVPTPLRRADARGLR